MVSTLIFKPGKGVIALYDDFFSTGKTDVVWTHITADEKDFLNSVLNEYRKGPEFREDLLENQRPRLSNFEEFSVIVISVPTKIVHESKKGVEVMQLAFIVTRNRLITITKHEFSVITKLMAGLSEHSKARMDISGLVNKITGEVIEHIINVIEGEGAQVDNLERDIVEDRGGKNMMQRIQTVKENHFFAAKMLRANLEVVSELINDACPYVTGISEHIEDRLLYAIDILDTSKDTVNDMNRLYMTVLSNRMNEAMQKLAFLAALLVIPTVISSIFGMNVTLPMLTFWEIIIVIVILTTVLATALKLLKLV